MAQHPYFADPEKQLLLEKFADGRCSAVSRNLGPDHRFAPRWRPTVAGHQVRNSTDPDDGFMTKPEAVAAAQRYRDSCREAIAQANGAL